MGEPFRTGDSTVNRESDVGNQPGDSHTRERRKLVVNIQPKVAETERQEPMVGNQEDPSVLELLVNQLLVNARGDSEERPTAGRGAGVLFLWRRRSQDQPVPASAHGLPFSTGGLVDEYGQWTVPS